MPENKGPQEIEVLPNRIPLERSNGGEDLANYQENANGSGRCDSPDGVNEYFQKRFEQFVAKSA